MYKRIIFVQSWIAVVGSLYYGRYGDPVLNAKSGQWFDPANGFTPCEMCRFARILIYPILLLIIVHLFNRDNKVVDYILPLSGMAIVLEAYQYYFQMSNSADVVKAFVCGDATGASCAATDVMYGGWVTIPLMCLVASIVIFVAALAWKMKNKK